MMTKKNIRRKFREEVFSRDGKCMVCNNPIQNNHDEFDSHHITDRNEMPNGGYVKENGITVCKGFCHMQVEWFHIQDGNDWKENLHPNDLYKKIGSSKELAIQKSKKL